MHPHARGKKQQAPALDTHLAPRIAGRGKRPLIRARAEQMARGAAGLDRQSRGLQYRAPGRDLCACDPLLGPRVAADDRGRFDKRAGGSGCGRCRDRRRVARVFFMRAPRMRQRPAPAAAAANIWGEAGWKIVALLRLGRAVPFTLQKYLFDSLRFPFWYYVMATLSGIIRHAGQCRPVATAVLDYG